MQSNLKLIVRYEARRNQYTLFRHNLTTEEAMSAVLELAARLFGLFVIDQHAKHSAPDPNHCEECRREVERSSHVQPKPTQRQRRRKV